MIKKTVITDLKKISGKRLQIVTHQIKYFLIISLTNQVLSKSM